MAICLAMFNPMRSARIIMNYLYVTNIFKLHGLPVFTIELVYEGREPEIIDAFHVRANSYMFHKENLLRILETRIPSEYTKLAFIDADIMFDNINWYSWASKLLDEYDIVHPFENCHWLDLTYTQKILTRTTIIKMSTDKAYDWNYHPGFAWCFRRDWYNKIGFYDKGFTGSGDVIFGLFIKKVKITDPLLASKTSEKTIQEYFKNNENYIIKSTYIPGVNIYHLYHGSRKNRQYSIRHTILGFVIDDIDTLVRINKDGVYEWINADKYNQKFLEYFKNRNDDGL